MTRPVFARYGYARGLVAAVIVLVLTSVPVTQSRAAFADQTGIDPAAAKSAAAGKAKPGRKPAARGKATKKKPQTKKPAAASTPAPPSEAGAREFAQLSEAQIEARIADARDRLHRDAKDQSARQSLALAAVELGNRMLDFDGLGRPRDAERLGEIVRTKLSDTLWRVSQWAASDARAAAAIGLFYTEGILAARDAARGCAQFERAAQMGHNAAAYQAALCLKASDEKRAGALLTRAAEHGHAGAEELMGRTCIEGEKQDRTCAINWLESAAAKGRPSAQSLLGWLYASEGDAAGLKKAAELYAAAAGADDRAAQNNLGELYELGRGVQQDSARAFDWYMQAAKAGFPIAELNVARLYAAGNGDEQNPAKAREWAERARDHGQVRAKELLDWLASDLNQQ